MKMEKNRELEMKSLIGLRFKLGFVSIFFPVSRFTNQHQLHQTEKKNDRKLDNNMDQEVTFPRHLA